MKKLPWFRMYSDVLTDRKISKICKNTGHSKALVIGLWTCLLSLASESPTRGTLLLSDDIPYTYEDLEDETGLPTETIAQLLEEYRSFGMVSGTGIMKISKWDQRQYKSDTSTERVKAYRERQNETLQKRYSNALDTDTETDKEIEVGFSSDDTEAVAFINQVIGATTIPVSRDIPREVALEKIGTLIRENGFEGGIKRARDALKAWESRRGKNGRSYQRTNLAWLDWAIFGVPASQDEPVKLTVSEELALARKRAGLE